MTDFMEVFTRRVMDIILRIPPGKIMTYGQVAAVAGNPSGARQVARILHACSEKYGLPWHRVINSCFRVSLRDGEQEALLQAEGVLFDSKGRVDPEVYLYLEPYVL